MTAKKPDALEMLDEALRPDGVIFWPKIIDARTALVAEREEHAREVAELQRRLDAVAQHARDNLDRLRVPELNAMSVRRENVERERDHLRTKLAAVGAACVDLDRRADLPVTSRLDGIISERYRFAAELFRAALKTGDSE